MDISSWIKSNQTIKLVNTKKKFYNKYLHKVVVYVPCGRIITLPTKRTCKEWIDHKIIQNKKYSSFYWSSQRAILQERMLNLASGKQLEFYKHLKESFKGDDSIKLRIEEPNIAIYSTDPDRLYDLVKHDPMLLVKEIHTPANSEAEEILNRGELIIKKKLDYSYKVVLKDRPKISPDVLASIHSYLENLGDQVLLTKSCRSVLKGEKRWYCEIYFYAKEESSMMFLNIICPGLISRFYKLSRVSR